MNIRHTERPIPLVPGTRFVAPDELHALDGLKSLLLDRFARAGYRRLRTPILEPVELPERKSGARIVSSLFTISEGLNDPLCLRPELTAGIVRAYLATEPAPPLPWRVGYAGPVFRNGEFGSGSAREFIQIGVELIGAANPSADGEVIWLADWAASEAGATNVTIRIGHVGLIREILQRSALPEPVQVALLEALGEAASHGDESGSTERVVAAFEHHLSTLGDWLRTDSAGENQVPGDAGDEGIDRLFRTLHPSVMGRRSSREVIDRLRRKWEMGHTLSGVLAQVRGRISGLADLRGKARAILDRLDRQYADDAPDTIAALHELIDTLADHGIDLDRVELDLGFGRGLGFYSQMLFVLVAQTAEGPVEICGGGRYDGLAREFGSDRDDHGVGFAFGLDRLAGVLKDGPPIEPSGFLIVSSALEARVPAIQLAVELRNAGLPIVLDCERAGDDALIFADAAGLRGVIQVGTSSITYRPVPDGQASEIQAVNLARFLRGLDEERAAS
jgi:histidyl-tRNA synthetase